VQSSESAAVFTSIIASRRNFSRPCGHKRPRCRASFQCGCSMVLAYLRTLLVEENSTLLGRWCRPFRVLHYQTDQQLVRVRFMQRHASKWERAFLVEPGNTPKTNAFQKKNAVAGRVQEWRMVRPRLDISNRRADASQCFWSGHLLLLPIVSHIVRL